MHIVYNKTTGTIIGARVETLKDGTVPPLAPTQAVLRVDKVPDDLAAYSVQNGQLVIDAVKDAAKKVEADVRAAKAKAKADAQTTLTTFAGMSASDFNKLTATQQAKALFDAVQALIASSSP